VRKIVITGEKGGTGKSTIAALLLEYLNYINKKANLLDLDPLQISTNYFLNCKEAGRLISNSTNYEYQIVDTPGVLGASLQQMNNADLIIVPFQAHYPDLSVIIP